MDEKVEAQESIKDLPRTEGGQSTKAKFLENKLNEEFRSKSITITLTDQQLVFVESLALSQMMDHRDFVQSIVVKYIERIQEIAMRRAMGG